MWKLGIALALAATGAHAQGVPPRSSPGPAATNADGTQPATHVNGTQPFLFDGRMKGDGSRRGAQVDHRPPHAGAIIMQPNASQPARE